MSNQSGGAQNDPDRERYENSTPVVYNTSRVNSLTLFNLKSFLEQYRKNSDVLSLEFDETSEESLKQGNTSGRFVLRNSALNTVIPFPDDLNDALIAFAVTVADKEARTLGEANLFRIVNWNDVSLTNSRPSGNSMKSLRKQEAIEDCLTTSNAFHNMFQTITQIPSDSTSTLSFEYIKSLSNLISSILEPKLTKQLSYTSVDIG